jgi:hypothetical protein
LKIQRANEGFAFRPMIVAKGCYDIYYKGINVGYVKRRTSNVWTGTYKNSGVVKKCEGVSRNEVAEIIVKKLGLDNPEKAVV